MSQSKGENNVGKEIDWIENWKDGRGKRENGKRETTTKTWTRMGAIGREDKIFKRSVLKHNSYTLGNHLGIWHRFFLLSPILKLSLDTLQLQGCILTMHSGFKRGYYHPNLGSGCFFFERNCGYWKRVTVEYY